MQEENLGLPIWPECKKKEKGSDYGINKMRSLNIKIPVYPHHLHFSNFWIILFSLLLLLFCLFYRPRILVFKDSYIGCKYTLSSLSIGNKEIRNFSIRSLHHSQINHLNQKDAIYEYKNIEVYNENQHTDNS